MSFCANLLTVCCLAFAGDGEAPRAVPDAKVAAKTDGSTGADVRDAMLMLDPAPLHVRFRLMLQGRSLSATRSEYIDQLMQSLDTNGDGKLSMDEAARSPLLATKRRGSANAFIETLSPNRTVTRSDILQTVERVGGETVVYRQDASAATTDQEVFKFLDADNSGFIDKAEMAAVAKKILERDTDRDETISFQEFFPPPPPDPNGLIRPTQTDRPADRPVATVAELLRDAAEPLLPRRLLKKYDKNNDGKLTPAELGWTAERVKMLDKSGDGKLDVQELGKINSSPVDLEISVDLASIPNGGTALTVLSTTGKPVENSKRPDLVRLAFPNVVLTLSFRPVDPVKASIDNAMRGFNQLDIDGNGYLDQTETSQRIRFERGLFDALDADGDGKIFGEEMEKYVRVRGGPATSTARVNIYDTGRGFFQALDANSDGRVSMREVRTAEKALLAMRRAESETLTMSDPVRHFHIEFVRGSFQLFGAADQMISQAPSFEERASVGPIWFQRMDRNNDGDLTRNEFLGPREVFHQLDTDHDGLIDPTEAAQAGEADE